MDSATRGTSTVPTLPPPRPKSPPEYPDLYGKRRELAKVLVLEREIGFLEEELKSVGRIPPASRCCKEVADFVGANADPLVTKSRKKRRSCSFWKWLCGKSCFSISWICCCGCSPHLEMPQCSCSCNICDCQLSGCCSMPKCPSCWCWPCSQCCKNFSCTSKNCCICRCPSCPDCSCSNSNYTCWCRPKCPKVPRCSCCIKNCCYYCCFCY